MGKYINMIGKVSGRLTVAEFSGTGDRGVRYWRCVCECGNEITVETSKLNGGRKLSCGCLAKDVTRARSVTHGQARHDGSRPPEYGIWHNMRYRCNNPKNKDWHNYGGKGIRVCAAWDDFATFMKDMGPRPTPKHTVERRDGGKDYCPENCFWTTMKGQQNNRSNNRRITYLGRTMTLAQWAEESGINYYSLWDRIVKKGWDVEKALTTPTKVYRRAVS